jgi:hypothetical protein
MTKIDCLREVKPPFSPESVVSELAKLLKSYRVFKVRVTDMGASGQASNLRNMASHMSRARCQSPNYMLLRCLG